MPYYPSQPSKASFDATSSTQPKIQYVKVPSPSANGDLFLSNFSVQRLTQDMWKLKPRYLYDDSIVSRKQRYYARKPLPYDRYEVLYYGALLYRSYLTQHPIPSIPDFKTDLLNIIERYAHPDPYQLRAMQTLDRFDIANQPRIRREEQFHRESQQRKAMCIRARRAQYPTPPVQNTGFG